MLEKKEDLLKLIIFVLILIMPLSLISQQTDTTQTKLKSQKDFVYVLHGLAVSKASTKLLGSRLEDAGFEVHRIGYKSMNKSPKEILDIVHDQIQNSLPGEDYTVHFVGHSLGGLVIRAYLDSNKVANLGRVVLLGTPNQGTEIVDKLQDTWLMKILGPTTKALGTNKGSFPNSIGDPYYPIGVIAAVTDLVNNEFIIEGKDDGLVPLESTKLNGMTDIIIIKGGHMLMKYRKDVANHTIDFLRNGKFKR